jgi:hypothetical protein
MTLIKIAPPGLRAATEQFAIHQKHIEEMPKCHLCRDLAATKEDCDKHGCCRYSCIKVKETSPYFKFSPIHGKLPTDSAKIARLSAWRKDKKRYKARILLFNEICKELVEVFSHDMICYGLLNPKITEQVNNVYMMRNYYGISNNYPDLIARLETYIPDNIKPQLRPKLPAHVCKQ